MKKMAYVAPRTEVFHIELEGCMMAGSKDPIEMDGGDVTIEDQTEDSDFTIGSWD